MHRDISNAIEVEPDADLPEAALYQESGLGPSHLDALNKALEAVVSVLGPMVSLPS